MQWPRCFLSLLLISGLAHAGTKEQEADALFKQARALLKADKPSEACPLLEKSHALDPGLGTLLNLADCFEKTGKLVQAYLSFNEAAAWADRNRESARADGARERASSLKPKLGWVALSTQVGAAGLTVHVNDFSIALGAMAQSVPVDPGELNVVASAPGFESFSRQYRVVPGQTVTVEVPALKPRYDLKPQEPAAAAVPPPPPAVEERPTQAPSRTGPVVLMGAGAVALIAGVSGLAWTFATYDRFRRQQPGGADALRPTVTRAEFDTMGWLYPASWVMTAVGIAAVGSGGLWLALSPSGEVSVGGTF